MKYEVSFVGRPTALAEGRTEGDSLVLYYESEKVNYKLSVSRRRVVHQTLGDGLSLEFCEGEKSFGTLRLGSRSASYPVYCSRLKVELFGSDISSGFSAAVSFNAPRSPTETVTFVVRPVR